MYMKPHTDSIKGKQVTKVITTFSLGSVNGCILILIPEAYNNKFCSISPH